ncbi:MAG TPA: MerR family transcriptional regulator [Acidimicrobiales bacterium]|nr:MerR family transcriptional regulator [Acidimicrobiales bacterium]
MIAQEAGPPLLGIGEAAAHAGVSERALRYYQQLGLITPSARTPGGMRRYSEDNLARVVRIRELQSLLGLNLEEIGAVLANEDRLAELRRVYRAEGTAAERRAELIAEGIALQEELRATIDAKLTRLHGFRDDVDATIERMRKLLAEFAGAPGP